MPFCRQCGSECKETDSFCRQCGAVIGNTGQPEKTEEPKVPRATPGRSRVYRWLILVLLVLFGLRFLALESNVTELQNGLQQKTAELERCQYIQNETQQSVNELKAHILFRGGNATAYYTLLDGTHLYTWYSINSLNYYVIEGNYNRRIIENYKKSNSEGSIKALFGSERTRRFYYEGKFRPVLILKSESDKEIQVDNYLAFIDTGSVLYQANYIKKNSRNDLEFVRNIVSLKTQVNSYTYNLMGQPRYPLETFLEGGGDCGASSLFIGSMIKAAHPEWTVQFWYVNSKSISKPSDTIDHAIVYVDNGDFKYFIETTTDDADAALNFYAGRQVYGWSFDF